jgi:hypothetical protein
MISVCKLRQLVLQRKLSACLLVMDDDVFTCTHHADVLMMHRCVDTGAHWASRLAHAAGWNAAVTAVCLSCSIVACSVAATGPVTHGVQCRSCSTV